MIFKPFCYKYFKGLFPVGQPPFWLWDSTSPGPTLKCKFLACFYAYTGKTILLESFPHLSVSVSWLFSSFLIMALLPTLEVLSGVTGFLNESLWQIQKGEKE